MAESIFGPFPSRRTQSYLAPDSPSPGRKPDMPEREFSLNDVPVPGHKPAAPPDRNRPPQDYAESARSVARISQVPFADILAKAANESNFNARERSRSSSAAGPFQFIEQTWLEMLKRHGSAYGLGREIANIDMRHGVASVRNQGARKRLLDLRHDIHLSAGMAARYLDESGQTLKRILKRDPSDDERRMAYLLGPGGAAKLVNASLRHPGGSASDTLPQAAQANRPLFFSRDGGALTNREAVSRITSFLSKDVRRFSNMPEDGSPLTTDRMMEDSSFG
ncbi:DNA-binding protein [Azospirillaceae bacterium]